MSDPDNLVTLPRQRDRVVVAPEATPTEVASGDDDAVVPAVDRPVGDRDGTAEPSSADPARRVGRWPGDAAPGIAPAAHEDVAFDPHDDVDPSGVGYFPDVDHGDVDHHDVDHLDGAAFPDDGDDPVDVRPRNGVHPHVRHDGGRPDGDREAGRRDVDPRDHPVDPRDHPVDPRGLRARDVDPRDLRDHDVDLRDRDPRGRVVVGYRDAPAALPAARPLPPLEPDLPPGTPRPGPHPAAPDPRRRAVGTAPVVGEGRHRALAQLAWIASALAAMGIAGFRIDWPAAWSDEFATWGMTTVGWGDLWLLLSRTDIVLGPYYVLIHAWADLFGTSDVALRLPSLLATGGTAALVAAIGSRMESARVGILAGVLFALLPTSSRYAQEARPYALVTCAAALATLMLLRACERPRFWRLAAYTGSVALVGVLHPVALALLAAHAVVVVAGHRAVFLRWSAAVVWGVLPALPLVYLGYAQKQQVAWIPLSTFASLLEYPGRLFGVTVLAGGLVAFALLTISFKRPAVVYTAWALMPAAVVFGVGFATPLWAPRYLLFTAPAWALLAATALGRAPLVRGVVALAVVAAVGVPAQAAMRTTDGHTQDGRKLAALLAAAAQPRDGIVYGDPAAEGWIGRDTVARYVPADKRPRDLLALRPARTGGTVIPPECTDVVDCLSGAKRVWVVRIGYQRDPVEGTGQDKEQALREYDVARIWRPRGLTLALLTERTG